MCSNRPEFLQVYLGCAWMGAVTVPLNTALRGIQLSHILRNSTPQLLVIEPSLLPAIETLEAMFRCRIGSGRSGRARRRCASNDSRCRLSAGESRPPR